MIHQRGQLLKLEILTQLNMKYYWLNVEQSNEGEIHATEVLTD